MNPIERIKKIESRIIRLKEIQSLLAWDQETYMPPKALENRAEQSAFLENEVHSLETSREWERIFEQAGKDSEESVSGFSFEETRMIDLAWKRYIKKQKVPAGLASEMSKAFSLGQGVWVKARKENDFSLFAPELEKIVDLNKQYAACVAPEKKPYDVLLDEYESGMTTESLDALFPPIQKFLKELVSEISEVKAPESAIEGRHFPVAAQDIFGKEILKRMGYDFERGRLDTTAHPFTITLGADDIRITTRYFENDPFPGLFSNMHEGGHGLYEQGYNPDFINSPLFDCASLGIHESQSRMWENLVGRSLPFWNLIREEAGKAFPDAWSDISAEQIYAHINTVTPSLIRVDADEVTYNLHIIIRYNLEKKLFDGSLQVADLPEAWNAQYKELLGIAPPDFASGVLQDVHWSAGLFGYFPTYALGNLYASQLWECFGKENSPDEIVGKGDFKVLLDWLRKNIHSRNNLFDPQELIEKVCGEKPSPEAYIRYINSKFRPLYGLK